MTTALQALQVVERDVSRRLIRSSNIEVLDYKPSSPLPDAQLAPPGTIAVYVACKGSPLLAELKSAVRDPKGGKDKRLLRKIVADLQCRKRSSADDVAKMAAASPVIADLSYAGTTLCKHLFVAPDSFGATLLPYSGGPLPKAAFRFDEYYRDGEDSELECVLVKHSPHLTEAEAAALKKVPPDLVHVFVAPGDLVSNTLLWFLAAAAFEAAVVYATFNISSSSMTEHLHEDAVKALGPAGSARALLALRKDLLRTQRGGAFAPPDLNVEMPGQISM